MCQKPVRYMTLEVHSRYDHGREHENNPDNVDRARGATSGSVVDIDSKRNHGANRAAQVEQE